MAVFFILLFDMSDNLTNERQLRFFSLYRIDDTENGQYDLLDVETDELLILHHKDRDQDKNGQIAQN